MQQHITSAVLITDILVNSNRRSDAYIQGQRRQCVGGWSCLFIPGTLIIWLDGDAKELHCLTAFKQHYCTEWIWLCFSLHWERHKYKCMCWAGVRTWLCFSVAAVWLCISVRLHLQTQFSLWWQCFQSLKHRRLNVTQMWPHWSLQETLMDIMKTWNMNDVICVVFVPVLW